MSTPISEYVSVDVTVTDALVQAAGFGVPALFDEFPVPANWTGSGVTGQRVETYTSLSSLALDFATTTKIHKMAQAVFAGTRAPERIKVLRADVGDADITTSLDLAEAEDNEWYGLTAAFRIEADINEIASWVSSATFNHIYIACSEDIGIFDSGDTSDVASDLKGFAYTRTGLLYHHNGGVDVTGAAYTITSLVITVAETAHGLRVGDTITFSASSGIDINGNNTVATVPDANSFTCTTTAVDEAGPQTVSYFARYNFPEVRWVGFMLPTEPGEEDWTFKPLTGQTPTPLFIDGISVLSLAEQQAVKAKNANIYTAIGGVGATQIGTMASGRFIDTQIGIDWLEARFGEAIINQRINAKKIPYTQAGINSLLPAIVGVVEEGERNGLLGVISDSTSGETYRVTLPQIADISQANKILRNLPPILITVQLAGSIITFTLDVTALI